MPEQEIPTIEAIEAKVEAGWENDRASALRAAAQKELRRLESLRLDREHAKRLAERQEEARERDYANSRTAQTALWGVDLAEQIDPAAGYDLIFIDSPPAVGFVIFSDATRTAEVRQHLRFGSSLYPDPERAATAISGVALGQFIKRAELLLVDPSDEEIHDLEKAARQEADARRQGEADREAQARKEQEQEHLKRRYGARVG